MPNPVPLEYGEFYHIYNRGNNREPIFREERNYRYFLQLYAKHTCPIAFTYAYGLLGNHFHLALRIKPLEDPADPEDLTGFKAKPVRSQDGKPVRSPSQAFSNLFNAYTKAFNKAYDRTGALFQRPFGRVRVTTHGQLCRLIAYIHRNPQKHGFVDDYRDWPHTSYHTLLLSGETRLERDEVLAWFEGADGFREAHRQEVEEAQIASLVLDDFD
jgi:hypothetical protein